jgi:hypothetical protein
MPETSMSFPGILKVACAPLLGKVSIKDIFKAQSGWRTICRVRK